MKSYINVLGTLLLTSLFNSISCSQQPLAHLLTQMERGRCSHITHVQDIALHAIRNNPTISLPELNCALDILLFTYRGQEPRFPVLRARINAIDRAINYFLDIPGFHALVTTFIRDLCNITPHNKLWHEFKGALDIEESDTNERITAFGIPGDYQGPALVHFHHIITNRRWLECKTIKWNLPYLEQGKRARNLRRQLLRQQQLINQYNALHGTQLSYELLCTHEPSSQWQTWLADHEIAYATQTSL